MNYALLSLTVRSTEPLKFDQNQSFRKIQFKKGTLPNPSPVEMGTLLPTPLKPRHLEFLAAPLLTASNAIDSSTASLLRIEDDAIPGRLDRLSFSTNCAVAFYPRKIKK